MEKVSKDYFIRFGYEKFGPLLLSFSNWLYQKCSDKNIKKIYFLARDGYILKNAFDIINDDRFETYYMYASRRCITVPGLSNIKTINDIFNIISFPLSFKLSTFIKKVGLDDCNIENIEKEFNLNPEMILSIDEVSKNKNIIKFMDRIIPLIKDNARMEKKNLDQYLKSISFHGTIAIVDIGWYGSMQKSLTANYPNANIFGFYLGLDPYGTYDINKYNGFIFDKTHDEKKCIDIYSYRAVFEFLTLAQHGSIKKIDKDGNAICYEYEYSNSIGEKISRIIHESSLKYVREHKDNACKFNIDSLSKTFIKPTLKDTKMWGDIRFYDNDNCYMAKPSNIIKEKFNIHAMINDFKKSGWKIGYMKRKFLIPFPYYKINNYLRNKYAKK